MDWPAPASARKRLSAPQIPLQGALVCTKVSDMSTNGRKTITGRQLRRGTPEERLMPGESIIVQKQGGKVFELKRVDVREKSILKGLDQLLEDIPNPGELARTNLARIIVEDRE
jgi:hypothetical protein